MIHRALTAATTALLISGLAGALILANPASKGHAPGATRTLLPGQGGATGGRPLAPSQRGGSAPPFVSGASGLSSAEGGVSGGSGAPAGGAQGGTPPTTTPAVQAVAPVPPTTADSGGPLPTMVADGAKPPIAEHGALFGAYVYYDHTQPIAPETSVLEGNIGRTLDVDHKYIPWTGELTGSVQEADKQAGRIPFVSWGCTNVAQIIDGSQDGVIRAAAEAVKAFASPIYIRWYWEMNVPKYQGCLDDLGPTGYIDAWRHIWTVFQQEGVDNAAWVWCPAAGHYSPSSGLPYYPGDQYVDYVCGDGYSRNPPMSFADLFGPFYKEWAARKPIIVGETGALASLQPEQAEWISQTAQAIETSFPDIKVFLYFDSAGHSDYTITSSGSIAALAAMARSPYFNPSGKPLRAATAEPMVDRSQLKR